MRLKQLRKERHLLQKDIAKMLEIPTSTYGNYEQELSLPSIFTIIKLADFYHVSLDYLIGRDYPASCEYLRNIPTSRKKVTDLPDPDIQNIDDYAKSVKDNKITN